MRYAIAAALLPLASCSYSLDREMLNLRAEISELERSIPPEAPLWIFDGPDRFDQFVEDFSPRVPDYIYLHLLRKLHGMKAEDVEALSRGDFDRAACLTDPSKFRGRIWRAHGVIAEIHAENVGGQGFPVRQAHAGIFFDRLALPVLFHVVQKPDVLILREDEVEIRGIFVKMIEYTTASGRQVVAPFFVGKILRRFV